MPTVTSATSATPATPAHEEQVIPSLHPEPHRENESHKTKTSGSNFFGLPREIRDEIYHQVWTGSALPFVQQWKVIVGKEAFRGNVLIVTQYPTAIQYGSLPFSAHHETYTFPHPRWIWTCRQLWTEATEQFYRHAQFTRHITNPQWCMLCHYDIFPRRMFGTSVYAFPHLERALHVRVTLGDEQHRKTEVEKNYCSPVYKILQYLCQVELGEKERVLRVNVKNYTQTLLDKHWVDSFPEEELIRELSRKGWVADVTREDRVTILEQF
mgnify:CR=1 FL=1